MLQVIVPENLKFMPNTPTISALMIGWAVL